MLYIKENDDEPSEETKVRSRLQLAKRHYRSFDQLRRRVGESRETRVKRISFAFALAFAVNPSRSDTRRR